jgi:hypothetical protein
LAPLMVFMPLFVKNSYLGNISTLAVLEMTFGIGTIVGGLALSAIRLEGSLGIKIATGMVGVALAYLGFTFSTSPVVGAACLGVLGFFLATTNVFSVTLFQTRLPQHNVPPLMSLVNLISVASLPVSMTVIGLILGSANIKTIAIACGITLLIVTVGIVSQPELRRA